MNPFWRAHGRKMESVVERNLEYYEQLYRRRGPLRRLMHGILSFDQKSKNRPNRRALAGIVPELLAMDRPPRVLEYGCGWGIFLLSLPRQVDAWCFDLSENAMAGLEEVMRFLGRPVSRASLTPSGALAQGEYDLIVCSHVLEHVDDDERVLRALVDGLRPGGYLLLNVPINEVWADPKHARAYTPELLKERVAAAGLRSVVEMAAEKWAGVFSRWDHAGRMSLGWRILRSPVRAAFAMLPYAAVLAAQRIFLSSAMFNQFIVVGRKPK